MSYVSQQFLLFDNSSLANFKNWAQAVSSAFSSSGWTQTSDTGQVNWSTIASVPSSGSFVYEIWQPADALQTGSTKFYVKVEYGTSSGSPAAPRIRMSVGTSTNGSGSMNGFTTSVIEPTGTAATGQGSIVTYDCYFSGDTDRFGFILWRGYGSQNAPVMFVIERTHNTDGTDSTDGVTLLVGGSTAAAFLPYVGQQTIQFGQGVAPASANSGASGGNYCAATDGNSTAEFNGKVPVSPVFPVYGVHGNPMTMAALVRKSDIGFGCQFTTTLYGATRNYIHAANTTVNAPTNCYLCMRYD